MPGYNHKPDCPCGWCWKTGATRYARTETWDVVPDWPAVSSTLASYTNPNARCPVCGDPVFFYRSPYNGRVFFDEMQPPWPKHPCTDNPRLHVMRFDRSTSAWRTMPVNPGWEPVIVEQVIRSYDWALLRLRPALPNRHDVTHAMPWRDDIKVGLPTCIKALNPFGIGRISMLDVSERRPHKINAILVHRVFVQMSVRDFADARGGGVKGTIDLARATFKDWEKVDPSMKAIRYDPVVDFALTKKWLKKAAAQGSSDARWILKTHPLLG